MSDYIKREDAITLLQNPPVHLSLCGMTISDAIKGIKELPSADVVEVVRCKDCKYNPRNPRSWEDDDIVEHYLWCEFMAIESKYNYCSKGARNEQLESD